MANLYTGSSRPYNMHCGTTDVYKVYAGSDLVWEFIPTTTTTTTIAPIGFNMTYTCTGGNATISISSFTAGSGQYQANTAPQTSIANAFSGTFMDVSTSYDYTSISNGTWYVVVRDKNNTSNATYHTVTFSCVATTTTTTTTSAPTYSYLVDIYDCLNGCTPQYTGGIDSNISLIMNRYYWNDIFTELYYVYDNSPSTGNSVTIYNVAYGTCSAAQADFCN